MTTIMNNYYEADSNTDFDHSIGDSMEAEICMDQTVAQLKLNTFKTTGVLPEKQRWISGGILMLDHMPLSAYYSPTCEMHLVLSYE